MAFDVDVAILAGGGGTRLWPLSRGNQPKQFLPLPGPVPLIAQSYARALSLTSRNRIWVVTLDSQVEATRRAIPGIPRQQILGEPIGRNSGPAVAAVTLFIQAIRRRPTTVLILTADHYIPDRQQFVATARRALRRAAEGKSLVTFGLTVRAPRTEYGYMEAAGRGRNGIRSVKRFIEKPPLRLAERFARSKNYFWNSGMFAWRSDRFADELQKHCPRIASPLGKVKLQSNSFTRALKAAYRTIPNLSIDYALMEKSRHVELVPSNFPWSDLGTWAAVHEASGKDSLRNTTVGCGEVLEGEGNLVHAGAKPVILFGVNDLVVVETDHATLVTSRNRSADLKTLQKTSRLYRP